MLKYQSFTFKQQALKPSLSLTFKSPKQEYLLRKQKQRNRKEFL